MTADDPADVDESDESHVVVTVADGLYVVEDDETGISSQGQTKPEALRNLAANLEVYEEGEEGGDDWL